jgi:hypothetical protein
MQWNHTNEFRVFRPQDQNFANEVALLGAKAAEEDLEKTEGVSSYNYLSALLSVFNGGAFDQNAIKRYLKAAYFAHTGEMSCDEKGLRSFHCSYVVAWLLQEAESKNILAEVNKALPPNQQITFPDLSQENTLEAKGKALDQWASNMAKQHGMALAEHITINIDSKNASVQRLYGFIRENPHLFQPVLRFVAPPKEHSWVELKKYNE